MSEQLNPGTTAVMERPQAQAPLETLRVPEAAPVQSTPEREAHLRELLGVEYDYLHDSGLVNYFDFDPDTGEDGIVHTLAGDAGQHGKDIPQGFHHEESGRIWGTVTTAEGQTRRVTRVERGHLATAKSNDARKFRERPGEPYLARVAIADRPKMVVRQTEEGTRLEHAKNAMYPKEYDALAVLQAVRQAYHSSDISNARQSTDDRGRPVLVVEGRATLIDGVTPMPIRLILNPDNYRIRTALPLVNGQRGLMNITEEQMMAHATYQTPTSSLRN